MHNRSSSALGPQLRGFISLISKSFRFLFLPALVQLLETIDAITPRDERGDLLVFLSGMSDMLAVSEGVREFVEGYNPRRWVVLMLHSSLSIEEQDKVCHHTVLSSLAE